MKTCIRLAIFAFCFPVYAADSLATLEDAYARIIQGDGPAARAILVETEPRYLTDADRAIRKCMLARLEGSAKGTHLHLDPWPERLLGIYERYWIRSLNHPAEAAGYEKQLVKDLMRFLSMGGRQRAPVEMGKLESTLQDQLRQHDLYGWFGVTQPLREFMLWHTQTDKSYEVDLPTGRESVNVSLLEGFVSYGWVGFATCDQRHVAGWTTPQHLYAVRSSSDLDSEEFRVGFLAHESQHFADLRTYPGLSQDRLEYRAKLTELTLRNETLHFKMGQFAANMLESGSAPHSVANWHVMHDLARDLLQAEDAQAIERLMELPAQAVHAAARKRLLADRPDIAMK